MKKVISLVGMLLLINTINAQSPVGKWKLVLAYTLDIRDKTTNLLIDDYEKEPCLKNVIYIFSSDGNIMTNADNCPDSTKKSLEASNLAIKWEISGDKKIRISTKDKDIDPITYDFNIMMDNLPPHDGKRIMNWMLTFPDDHDINNPDRVKKLFFVYWEL